MTTWTRPALNRFSIWLTRKVSESPHKAVFLAPEHNMPSIQIMHWNKLNPLLSMPFKMYLAETSEAGHGEKRKLDYILVGETAQGCWAAFKMHYDDTRLNAMTDHDDEDTDDERKEGIKNFVSFLDHIATLVQNRLEAHFGCDLSSPKILH